MPNGSEVVIASNARMKTKSDLAEAVLRTVIQCGARTGTADSSICCKKV